MNIIKILIIVTNTGMYAVGNLKTGLWLSELTHIYHAAKQKGYEITIASPNGGNVPIDPESLKLFTLDKISKEYWNDLSFKALLENSKSLADVSRQQFDVVYLAGGHGTMYDFPNDTIMQSIISNQYESGKMVAAICHGVGGLLNVKLSDGTYLIKDKKITGFNWFEESLANRKKKVPFNLEAALKDRGSAYEKAFIPMTSKVVVDGNLVTGQNPFSSKEMAKVVMRELEEQITKAPKAISGAIATTRDVSNISGIIKGDQVMIDLAGHQVPVLKGGLYDRFRSNPPLSVIAEERPDIDLSWFKTIQKQKKEVGFTTYSPNFYYRNSSITAIYTADMKRLKELIPEKVRDIVKPISMSPGRGLIAITSYAYHYCDNDSYNELSISIVTTKPNKANWGIFSLLGEVRGKDLWGYVLKLPVNTELARVRGVVGYNLPKWLIPIEYDDSGSIMSFTYYDEAGSLDFSMIGKKLDVAGSKPEIVRSNFINLSKKGELIHGYTDVRGIQKASSKKKNDLQLKLCSGSLSEFIRSLGLGKLIRYDYQPDFQAALYMPGLVQDKKK